MDGKGIKVMIHVENLTKRFGDLTAVDDLNFEVRKNEIFGLLGPNGAGKTTTINMICGLLQPSSGYVRIENSMGSNLKSLIGYCPQENIFYPKLTCFEQLVFIGQMYGMPLKILRKRAMEMLELLGLGEKTHKLAANLSGGMKRRLNICLAMIHDPEILVLDEPEAGLDPQSRILVRNFFKLARQEKTVILTTHNMDEADRMSDRVAIMDHGKLLLIDSPTNLKRTIGEGDVLEITFENGDKGHASHFTDEMGAFGIQVRNGEGVVLLKHLDILGMLPAIKEKADASGLTVTGIRLRENSLEDVFIHLTGRKLRE
jgi:ABC-2 type transport system ATP-binding protein